jgi:hypothetical protein
MQGSEEHWLGKSEVHARAAADADRGEVQKKKGGCANCADECGEGWQGWGAACRCINLYNLPM